MPLCTVLPCIVATCAHSMSLASHTSPPRACTTQCTAGPHSRTCVSAAIFGRRFCLTFFVWPTQLPACTWLARHEQRRVLASNPSCPAPLMVQGPWRRRRGSDCKWVRLSFLLWQPTFQSEFSAYRTFLQVPLAHLCESCMVHQRHWQRRSGALSTSANA